METDALFRVRLEVKPTNVTITKLPSNGDWKLCKQTLNVFGLSKCEKGYLWEKWQKVAEFTIKQSKTNTLELKVSSYHKCREPVVEDSTTSRTTFQGKDKGWYRVQLINDGSS